MVKTTRNQPHVTANYRMKANLSMLQPQNKQSLALSSVDLTKPIGEALQRLLYSEVIIDYQVNL